VLEGGAADPAMFEAKVLAQASGNPEGLTRPIFANR
jgi:hypothetical protein